MALWDAVRFCKDFNIPFIPPEMSSGKVSTGWIGVQCPNPRCNRNTLPDYGGFNIPGGYYSCWSCGGHTLPRVVKWLLKINNHEVQNLIWDYTGSAMMSSSLNYKKKKAGHVKVVDVPGGALKRSHKEYLEYRGFDPDYLIEKYDLRAVGKKTETTLEREYKNRIIIPIITRDNKIISFQGRDVTDTQKVRYKGCHINKSVVNYKHTLYGLPFASNKQCALVEGVIDQWAMGDGFLCTFGTALTAYQIREISYFEKIFILFDPENTAQVLAEKVAHKLAALDREVEVIKMDSNFDPGDLGEDDIRYIRRELGFI